MDNIHEFNPSRQHRFQLSYQNVVTRLTDRCLVSTLGAARVSVRRPKGQRGVLTVVLRDEFRGETHEFLDEILHDPAWIDIKPLNGKADTIGYRLRFTDLSIEDHGFGFDYASDQDVEHTLTISFGTCEMTRAADLD